jgi:hypothetical protein
MIQAPSGPVSELLGCIVTPSITDVLFYVLLQQASIARRCGIVVPRLSQLGVALSGGSQETAF